MQIRITAEDFQAEAETIIRRKFDARIAVHATPTLTSTPEEESPEASEVRRDSPLQAPLTPLDLRLQMGEWLRVFRGPRGRLLR
eukprot:CAMPEP_0172583954 /NCGR_PEP_ID=MMETSP1068-20121228/3510_1 /TAXON_ID=35684 /ORGANISM="Pseudopedinella elastica, Strain CCMP716" /LENGTH=83 /DNA_ID=CAMNT_0013377937 /DNA_START=389 /DNA_END=640 /DNA_ORIENTATION=-